MESIGKARPVLKDRQEKRERGKGRGRQRREVKGNIITKVGISPSADLEAKIRQIQREYSCTDTLLKILLTLNGLFVIFSFFFAFF